MSELDELVVEEPLPDELTEEEAELPTTIPLSVSRSLRSSLGDESAQRIEQVFYDALDSDSERIRLDAAKTLGQFAIALKKDASGGGFVPRPKTPEEVRMLTLDECFAYMTSLYLDRLKSHVDELGREEGIEKFLSEYAQDGVLREMVSRLSLIRYEG